jgi:cytochrome d ubiquinol oxidase subunit I
VRTTEVASTITAPLIGLTLTLYVVLYVALVLAYVAVLKYMAEKSEEAPTAQAEGTHP